MNKKHSMTFALVLSTASFVGLLFARDVVEFFLLAELISLAVFFILFSMIAPTLFPEKGTAGSVFTGGAAKPPYLQDQEVYIPPYPYFKQAEVEGDE